MQILAKMNAYQKKKKRKKTLKELTPSIFFLRRKNVNRKESMMQFMVFQKLVYE